jgi:hypothetical protein
LQSHTYVRKGFLIQYMRKRANISPYVYMMRPLVIYGMTLQLLPYEFPYM